MQAAAIVGLLALSTAIVLMFVPIVPVRKRRNKPADGMAITPEVEKARQNLKKAVTQHQDGRG